jgi:hypothetical protein
MNSEILKERWYNYRRVYCKEGFIEKELFIDVQKMRIKKLKKLGI